MVSEHSIRRTVEFSETDMAGIMHFSNYFRWMESAETAFLRSLGVPLINFVPGQVVGWPRVSATCDYRAPLRFGDVVEVKVLVKELRTRAIVFLFQFRKVVDGQVQAPLVSRGEIVAVCVTDDGEGGMMAQAIPDVVRSKIAAAPKEAWAEG